MAEAMVTGPSLQRPDFDPRSLHVGFVVNKVALEQVSCLVLMSSYVNVIL
jgi:hypothetical protein